MFVFRSTYKRLQRDYDILQQDHDSACAAISSRDQTIRETADTIRNMDSLIFRMGQCLDWESMRPLFNKLQEAQELRQRHESNRINSILQTELISIYAPEAKALIETKTKLLVPKDLA